MYCPKCGKIVDEGVKFCPYCGESLIKSENKPFNNSSTNKSSTSTKINKKDGFFKNISTKRKCCYVFIILLILFAIVYIPYVIQYNENREDIFSFHQDELDALDIDGDGYLTFDEAKEYGNKTPKSKLQEFFNIFDHNKNGLLKGDEWDKFRYAVYEYEHPPIKKTQKKNSNSSPSSISSKSSSDYRNRTSPEYELWEEEEIVEYDKYGKPVYVCVYYTSGDKYFDPGVYTAIGNEYSGWDYEYEGSNWRSMFN